MNTKRIIQSTLMLLVVAGVTAAGTGAFFSDTETSAGNVFTAGSIDLMIDHTAQSYNGVSCQTCGVEVYSSTDTIVASSSLTATEAGSLPKSAELVTTLNPAWLNPSTISPAQWIWVTPTVTPGDTTNNAEYTFVDTFFLQGPISLTDIELEIASDNGYKIVINGVEIVNELTTTGTFTGLNPLTSGQKTNFQNALIQNGQNSLEITVRNLARTSGSGPNPAGLIYKINFSNQDCEAGVADFQQTCELWESTDLTNESFFNFSDIKPQDEGTNLISMTVESNESYVCLDVNNADNIENSYLDAEVAAGDTTDDQGEMGEFLQVAGWYADGTGDVDSLLFGPIAVNDAGSITYADSNTGNPVQPGETQYMELAWCMGDMTADDTGYTCDGAVPDINQTQTDAFLADLQFFAIQTRNNEDYTCGMPLPGDGDGV